MNARVLSHFVSIIAASTLTGLILMAWPSAVTLSGRIDTWANPCVGLFVARDWRRDEGTGFWSAHVLGEKTNDKCVYAKGQIVTGIATPRDAGAPFEVLVTFVDDDSPDSSRPEGWQSFGRWRFDHGGLAEGMSVRVNILHTRPTRDGEKTVSSSLQPPFIVGRDSGLQQ